MVQAAESALRAASRPVRAILDRVLRCGRGSVVSVEDAQLLLETRAQAADLRAIVATADALRAVSPCKNSVTYVVNRNINFTNACAMRCKFCAFSRSAAGSEAYLMPLEEIERRALEAVEFGATEVCMQAGLPGWNWHGEPWRGRDYVHVASRLKSAAPGAHLHAFSPEEVRYGSRRGFGSSIEAFLRALRDDGGVNSLPGTSAEVLDDDLRSRLSPGRISTREWIEVVRTAHYLGLPTTATVMIGHIETPAHIARHIGIVRDIQLETAGFTEFVPLPFVARESPMWLDVESRAQLGVRSGASRRELVLVHAVSRIMLAGVIHNIQASWPKISLEFAATLLRCGVNDLGGVLMNESISAAAGATHGQCASPARLQAAALSAGREPRQRTTTYGDVASQRVKSVDKIDFGSYGQLVSDTRWRARDVLRRQREKRQQTRSLTTSSRVVTVSIAHTIVNTFECYNSCRYCNFKSSRPSGDERAWVKIDDVRTELAGLRDSGVAEILVLSGEVSPRSPLRERWADQLVAICEAALDAGMLPHANAGPLSRVEMTRLKAVTASMGLMLEAIDSDLNVHRAAPSKRPTLRLDQLRLAGELRIPFTTGLLFGIGETQTARALDAIAELHLQHGRHIQECIIQPLSIGRARIEPELATRLPHLVQLARARLPDDIAIQIPPNLVTSATLRACLENGASDIGGISIKDEVNPDYAFSSYSTLKDQLGQWGFDLRRRLPVHDRLKSWMAPRVQRVAAENFAHFEPAVRHVLCA